LSDNEKVDDVILKNPTNTDLKRLPDFMNEQLVELTVRNSKYVTDITPLGALPHLKSRLTLEYLANLSDLTPLGNLAELKDVALRRLGEPVTIAPLSSFANLEKLTLSELNKNIDDVFDISPLAGKPLLKNVTLYGTKVKDLSPLQDSVDMERLYFDYIAAEDLSPLKGFTKLTYLLLGDMPATDLSAVGELTALTQLSIGAVDVTDLSFLSSLKALKYLTFNNIPAKDMTPVGDLTELRTIDLYKTSFDDYSPLAKCTTLEKLTARYDGEHFDNLDVIRSMPNMKQVWVDSAPNVQAWEALGTAMNLESFSANRTSFSDLSLLADKVKLESLYFDECTVIHPEALISLPKLRYFGMKKTQGIEDIRPFKNLWTIDTVSLYYTQENFPQEQVDELNQTIEAAKKLQKIYDEQFYNNNNQWTESSSEDSELQVADEHYLFEHKKDDASWMSWNSVGVDYTQDFSIEAAIEKIHGPESSGYGLIWGLEDTKNRYQFLVNGNGAYTYAKTIDGTWEAVIEWTESSFVNTGNAANTLSVRRLGDDVQLYINHRYVATVPFEETFGPKAGFFVHGPTKVGIDYLLVKGTKAAE
jgi:Leucine-rich repeat (LRR) protein